MTPKITEIYNKYLSLTQKLSDPSIPAGSEEWTKIAKEQSELMETAAKYEEYLAESKKGQQAEEALKTETDAEMRELLNEEVYECKRRLDADCIVLDKAIANIEIYFPTIVVFRKNY